MPIHVLLADHTPAVRKAIRTMLETEPGIRLVAEAASLAETVELARKLKPHIVLMDVHMPDEEEIPPQHVRSHLTAADARVLAMSVWNDESTRAKANDFGAIGFLDKMRLGAELIPAIKQCAASRQE
ncbi:MAG: response regulator [Candidatus Acidiferrales bacterium]